MFRSLIDSKFLCRCVLAMVALTASCAPAQAAILFYGTTMSGALEDVPNASLGNGSVLLTVDTVLNTMRVEASFSGLTSGTTAAHIHAATALPGSGTAVVATATPTFLGFPSGVTAGVYDTTFDMLAAPSYRPGYITANGGTPASAFAALLSSFGSGTSYFNIHSTTFTGGEIRGFITAVPEPSSMALLGAFVVGAGWTTWRRRKTATV